MMKPNLTPQPNHINAISLEKTDVEGIVRLIVFATESLDGDIPGARQVDSIVEGSITGVTEWWIGEGIDLYGEFVHVQVIEDGMVRWERPDELSSFEAAEAAMSFRKDLFD